MAPLPLLQSTTQPSSLANFCCFTPFFLFPDYKAWSQATSNIFVLALGRCLRARRLSFDENVPAKEGGKETTGGRLRLPSVPFPWSLAVHHQSLAFRARLCHAKNEAPEEEAASDVQGGMKPPPPLFIRFLKILSRRFYLDICPFQWLFVYVKDPFTVNFW